MDQLNNDIKLIVSYLVHRYHMNNLNDEYNYNFKPFWDDYFMDFRGDSCAAMMRHYKQEMGKWFLGYYEATRVYTIDCIYSNGVCDLPKNY